MKGEMKYSSQIKDMGLLEKEMKIACKEYQQTNDLGVIIQKSISDNIFMVNTERRRKELAYKKSLKEDKFLDKYRKRYMSLASSVSHYGTDTAIERFEKYKKDGAIMKQKYLNKEITPKEFEKWILDSKK